MISPVFFQSVFLLVLALFPTGHAVAATGTLDAQGVSLVLGDTVDGTRLSALKALLPQIRSHLSGQDITVIVGEKSSAKYRSFMIQKLAPHAQPGLTATEVAKILGETDDGRRLAAVKALEPAIQYGLTAAEFAQILGSTEGKYRGYIIGVLASHSEVVGTGTPYESPASDVSESTNSPSDSVNRPDNTEIDVWNSDSADSFVSPLRINPISQQDFDEYLRGEASATTLDRLGGKTYPVHQLACLATVYTMIQRALGDTGAKVDDFYEDPGSEGESKDGAFIPPLPQYEALSGRTISAAFTSAKYPAYDATALVKQLEQGGLAILKGERGGYPHFTLVDGYKKASDGRITELRMVDPWDKTRSYIPTATLSSATFSQVSGMRLVTPAQGSW